MAFSACKLNLLDRWGTCTLKTSSCNFLVSTQILLPLETIDEFVKSSHMVCFFFWLVKKEKLYTQWTKESLADFTYKRLLDSKLYAHVSLTCLHPLNSAPIGEPWWKMQVRLVAYWVLRSLPCLLWEPPAYPHQQQSSFCIEIAKNSSANDSLNTHNKERSHAPCCTVIRNRNWPLVVISQPFPRVHHHVLKKEFKEPRSDIHSHGSQNFGRTIK